MALTCPNCEKLNRCGCKSCNPNNDKSELVIIDYENSVYQCYFCSHKFTEQDSLDFEWDMMHKNIKNSITPEMSIKWKELQGKEKKEFEESSSYGQYGFESAFFQHFNIRHNNCDSKQIQSIKIQIDRELKINKIND